MKTHLIIVSFLFLGCFVMPNGTLAERKELGEHLIRHRAAIGGDCEDRDHCVGIVGNQAYNYQATEKHGNLGVLKNMDDVEKGNLQIGQKGLELDGRTRSKFNLDKGDIEDVRSVHQYVEIKRDIEGKIDGNTVELGNIESENNRKMRNIENIVKIDGGIKGVSGGGDVGQVTFKNSDARYISNSTEINGEIDRSRQGFSIGGVQIMNGAANEGIKNNVLIRGRKNGR